LATAPLKLAASTVIFAGIFRIRGAVLSLTVTVNVAVLVLFNASLAVIMTVVVPNGNTLPLNGLAVSDVTPTLSLAVGIVYVTTAPLVLVASAKIFAGTPFIIGAVASLTVTVNDALLILLAASLAVIVTVVVPNENTLPLGGIAFRETTPTLSVTVGIA